MNVQTQMALKCQITPGPKLSFELAMSLVRLTMLLHKGQEIIEQTPLKDNILYV